MIAKRSTYNNADCAKRYPNISLPGQTFPITADRQMRSKVNKTLGKLALTV